MEGASSSSPSPTSGGRPTAPPATGAAPVNGSEMWCCVKKEPHQVSFTFTIDDFLNTTGNMKMGENIKSTNFWADGKDGVEWYLMLYPKGDQNEKTKNGLALFLTLAKFPNGSKSPSDVEANVTFSILNKNKDSVAPYTLRHQFSATSGQNCWGCRNFVSQASLSSSTSSLLCDGKLIISCKLTYFTQKNFVAVSGNNTSSLPSTKKPRRSLVDDTAQLLSTMEHGDLTLQVGERKIRAHKFMLAIRSPVFAAMFQHNMKEKRTDTVDLEDVKVEVLQAMLHFIYTDELMAEIDSDVALLKDLLTAADKYQVELLKFKCEQLLSRRLAVDNCVDFLLLADRHSAESLRQFVVEFICSNSVNVMKTEAWKDLKTRSNVSHILLDVSEALAARVPKAS